MREWQFSTGEMVVRDSVNFEKPKRIAAEAAPTMVASFHLHPEVMVESGSDDGQLELRLPSGEVLVFDIDSGRIAIEDTTWHPEFGLSVPNKVIRVTFDSGSLACRLRWGGD